MILVNGLSAGWRSSEFWMTVSTLAVSMIMAFVSFGTIDPANAEDITKHVTSVIGGIGAMAIGLAGLWKYMAGRVELKREVMRTEVQTLVARKSEPAITTVEYKQESPK